LWRILTPLLYLILLLPANTSGQKVIFLHHSTGGNVYYQGHVAEWISNYNSSRKTSIEITERSYPDSPYPWENYPYDYWNLWVNGSCDTSEAGIECISSLAEKYQVIIFKHCFPGASIQSESGDPDVSSGVKTLSNYKLQYRALRQMMDNYPDNLFIVWTLAPLHRLSTNAEEAARASEFVNWVKNEWLTEDGMEHRNIKIFDFWGYTAQTNLNPINGEVNCLSYELEISHTDGDSHPNLLANETIGPFFAGFIVNTIVEFNTPLPWDPANPNAPDDVKKVLKFLYDIKGKGIITGQQNLATDVMWWTNEVMDITGLIPGLLGEDFSYGDSACVRRQQIVKTAIDYWNKGGLVTISWHQVNPTTWDGSVNEGPFEYTQLQMTQDKFNQIFIPESELQVKYLRHIDTIAGYLKQLQDAGVVVLWRPYHEMNGGWFWWGAKSNYKDLWRGMFNRYTYYHHLNNLIWVWGPNISQSGLESYYPGDDYVDIVGYDGYVDITNWDVRTSLSEEIDNIVALSKGEMITFTELGWLPDLNWLQEDRPEFTWFLCWWTHITDYNSERWINKVYHHPYAINRGDYIWKDFPVILVKEFEDLSIHAADTSITVLKDLNSHYYYPSYKNIHLDITANRNDIGMEISDSIVLSVATEDTGTIIFTVVAANEQDTISRQFSINVLPPVSVQPETDAGDRITLFPNPASNLLQITRMNRVEKIIIYDLTGRTIRYIINNCQQERQIDIGDLMPGYYTICFIRTDGAISRHFVKM
jgi:mannan endo-1,4-beta-mannosidase